MVSSNPCRLSSRRTCSMIGRLATGSMGLGWLAVIGRSRVPSPPAMTTAFNGFAAPFAAFRLYFPHEPTLGMYPTAVGQASYLGHVQHRGPPVQDGSPDREGPAYDPGQRPAPAGVIAEEQQRERVEQAQGGGLADQADLQGAEAGPAFEHGQRPAHHQLADREDGDQPPRDDFPYRERDDGRRDVQPVGQRIEHLAEPAALVQRAGNLAVQPVGNARGDEQRDRPVVGGGGARPEDEPQEDRDSSQPGGTDRVRDRQDAVHGPSILT